MQKHTFLKRLLDFPSLHLPNPVFPLKDVTKNKLVQKTDHDKSKIAEKILPEKTGALPGTAEESQSAGKGYEVSKEKLRYTAEELTVVSQQPDEHNEQFRQAMLYTKEIFAIIHLPLLILSRDFRIKNASKSFYDTFLIPEEEAIGKILFDLQNYQWNIPGLRNHLLRIQSQNEKVSRVGKLPGHFR